MVGYTVYNDENEHTTENPGSWGHLPNGGTAANLGDLTWIPWIRGRNCLSWGEGGEGSLVKTAEPISTKCFCVTWNWKTLEINEFNQKKIRIIFKCTDQKKTHIEKNYLKLKLLL